MVLSAALAFVLLFPALAEQTDADAAANPELEEALAELDGKVLTRNSKDPLLIRIKKRLNQLSYTADNSNLFDDLLDTKVRQLQRNNNVEANGVIDEDFLRLIYSDHCVTGTGIVMSEANDYTVSHDYTLLGDEQFCAGEDGNIIVIILDTFSNSFFNELLKDDNTAKGLEDFTYYDNYDCCFVGTYPSMVMMFTGYEYDNSVTIGEWFSNAWKSERTLSFFNTMKEKGYATYMYSVSPDQCGLKSEAIGLIENYVKNSEYSGEVIEQKVFSNFYTALQGNGVTAKPGKRLIIQHLHGLHTPYNVDENGHYMERSWLAKASCGWIAIAKAYLEALKEAGVYDNSTIIIMADHGPKNTEQIQPMFLIKRAGEMHDEMQVTNAPVSHKEFQSTLLYCAGVDKDQLPSWTIYDFEEDEDRERTVYINKFMKEYPQKPRYNGTGWGSHNVWVGYTYTGDSKDLAKQGRRRPTDYIEMYCSFN